MMRNRLKSDLFGRNLRSTSKTENEEVNITTINIFDDEKTRPTTKSIDSYIREFDFDVHLDNLQGSEIATSATFIKGDTNTSILNAHVFKSNIPVNLSNVTVTVNIKETRGKTTIPADVIDVNGVVQINLPTSVVDEVGMNSFELVFQSGDKVIISPTYTYKVLNSLGSGSIGTDIEKTTLQALIEQVQESKGTVDTIVDELEVTQSDIDDIISMIGGL